MNESIGTMAGMTMNLAVRGFQPSSSWAGGNAVAWRMGKHPARCHTSFGGLRTEQSWSLRPWSRGLWASPGHENERWPHAGPDQWRGSLFSV